MTYTTGERTAIIGGVDTHQDLHTAAVVNLDGAVLGGKSFSTTRAGYRAMLRWFRSHGVRIPVQADHRFRCNPITDSGASRSLIPAQADHRFRSQADHFSALTGIVRFVRCEGVHDAGYPLAMTSSGLFQRGTSMAFRRLSMRKIHSTLRLFFEAGLSIRAIARTLRVSPSTVGDSIRRAQVAGLSWPLPEGLDERALEARLFPGAGPACDAGLGARSRRVAAQGGHPVAAVAGGQGRASRGASVQPVLRALPRLRPRRRCGVLSV